MALENDSMSKKLVEIIDRFIIDTIESIRKFFRDYVLNKNNSVTVCKQVVEKRLTFLTTNGTLENKPNSNKKSFRVKD